VCIGVGRFPGSVCVREQEKEGGGVLRDEFLFELCYGSRRVGWHGD
jgi:hypothetical protein